MRGKSTRTLGLSGRLRFVLRFIRPESVLSVKVYVDTALL